MKRITLIFLFLFCFIISKAQINAADEKQASAMLKTFYTAYMSAFTTNYTKPGTFNDVLKNLRKRYCTPKCNKQYIKLVEKTDGDPIIKGQDSDAKWAKTLSVKRNLQKPDQYSVSYYNDEYGEDGKLHKVTTTIDLVLIKQGTDFKIDRFL